jgi:hypothetical protein
MWAFGNDVETSGRLRRVWQNASDMGICKARVPGSLRCGSFNLSDLVGKANMDIERAIDLIHGQLTLLSPKFARDLEHFLSID